jgi:DNA-directed RNA polymerase subunit beta
MDIPSLIEVQKRSYERFLQANVPPDKREDVGLQAVFNSVFPITDLKKTSSLKFVSYSFGTPKYTADECRQQGVTYAAPLKVIVQLEVCERDKETDARIVQEIKEQEIYLGEIPLITEQGVFIINGTERTVVSQMHRSPGVFFSQEKSRDHTSISPTFTVRLIPYRGSWVEFELGPDRLVKLKIDRRRALLGTTLLRALGYETNEQILSLFYSTEEITLDPAGKVLVKLDPEIHLGLRAPLDVVDDQGNVLLKSHNKFTKSVIKKMQDMGITHFPINFSQLQGRISAENIVDEKSGEVILECNQEFDEPTLAKIASSGITTFKVLALEGSKVGPGLRDTLARDGATTREAALIEIYKRMRPGDPPTVENAFYLFSEMFFNPKIYDLSPVGRLKINRKLGLNVPLEERTLKPTDFVEIIRYLYQLANGYGEVDDIDHLGNRRVRSVGELLENQFRVGLVRMERAIRERMSICDLDNVMPHDLVNAKPVTAVIKEFFGSSQLSQFMDQTNPLAELTHKRRLSALGPGGLSRERAGFEARDVHPTHYGRICPIETPEGPNIGLITSLSTYARVNDFGFIETPYRKVVNGRVTDKIEYLTAIDEIDHTIAQANAPVDEKGYFTNQRISARQHGEFIMVPPEQVDYMDVSPKQLVSVSTSLIPFLENDDANRALMGSNMQRQAVPLLRPDAPLIGTGMEEVVARDSGGVVLAKRAGVVESVTANRIIIRADQPSEGDNGVNDSGIDIYNLRKFQRSNQNTCTNQKPIVRCGQRVKQGQVIADGPATSLGELALGQNVLVAFLPWRGYNFEDAIIISEKVVKDDRYTSIHIEEFEIEARDTKLGKEEITRDIPNVSEETLRNLDESGIIRVGAEVKPGDVLVGKVTPKGETQLTPEEKLLRAIFGEKAGDVKDASLTVPPGIEGVVVDVKIFSRKGVDKDKRTESIEEEERARLEKDLEDEIRVVRSDGYKKVKSLLVGQQLADKIVDAASNKCLAPKGRKLDEQVLDKLESYFWKGRLKVKDADIQSKIEMVREGINEQVHILKTIYEDRFAKLGKGGELAPGVIKLVKVYIAMKRKLSVGDKMAGRHGNKGVIAKIVPEQDMPYLPDGTPVEIILNPLGVPSRMNVGQILETHLGWAAKALGVYMSVPVFEGPSEEQIREALAEANLPTSGKTTLYDGRTGEPMRQEVSVGHIYMMKLAHLVDDKIHARSIGPYSLITQQPLGGKAQFGGQRFGEMEVWALEAYGAAYTLQEMLTIKSDDVQGRTKAYEAIVKGEPITGTNVPESFNVLVKELQSLCLDVELLEQGKTSPES